MRHGTPIHTDELTAFHAARMDLYLATFELLRMPPRPASLEAARSAVEGNRRQWTEHPALGPFVRSLETTRVEAAAGEYARLFDGGPVASRCPNPGCPVRGEAFAAVAVLVNEELVAELKVLSLLAARTTEALQTGNLPEASILTDVQGRFLAHHAGPCLGRLGAQLRATGAPLYTQVGSALGWLIGEDLKLLGYPGAPSR